MKLVFWSGVANKSEVINIYEFNVEKTKDGKYTAMLQKAFDEATEWVKENREVTMEGKINL